MAQIAIILIPIVGISILLPQIKRRAEKTKAQVLVCAIFVVYICGNLYFTVLSRNPGIERLVDLKPFGVYTRLFEQPLKGGPPPTTFIEAFLGSTLPIVGLILNILLYYPLGYLLPILFPKLKPKHVIFIGCLCSIATEATQYFLKMGWCETDDVIHKTLGTAIGVWIWHLQSKRLNKQNSNELPKE